jgi:hypothetical protein
LIRKSRLDDEAAPVSYRRADSIKQETSMYEFIETPTGWKVFWGPMPRETQQSLACPQEQVPAVIASESVACPVNARGDEILTLAV